MVKTEQILLRLYTVLVGLYPRQFRHEFEEEMKTVFGEALTDAHKSGWWAMLRLCSREVSGLSGALMREYGQLEGEEEIKMLTNNPTSIAQKDLATARRKQVHAHGWKEIFLALLPFVLILVADILPKLLVEAGLLSWEAPAMEVLNTTLSVLLIATILLIIIVGRYQKWPDWSASWFAFLVLAPIWLVSWVLDLLQKKNGIIAHNLQLIFFYQLIPLVIAVLLYSVTRLNRARGLLVALPLLYLLWFPNMEFVPDPVEISIKTISIALICLVIAFLLRRGDWRSGFFAILLVNLTIGCLFSYASTYHGGTLPFTASGPNMVEVLRILIPQYLATSAILLGPLFAWMFRRDGLARGTVASIGYHLALGGLLLVIIANLAGLMTGMENSTLSSTIFSDNVLRVEISLGMLSYAIGLFLQYRNALFSRAAPVWAEHLLLFILPLALPIALNLPFFSGRTSFTNLYGIPQLWKLPHDLTYFLGVMWLLLSIWLITRKRAYFTPQASLTRASEAPILS